MITKKNIVSLIILPISIFFILCFFFDITTISVWAKPSHLYTNSPNLYFFHVNQTTQSLDADIDTDIKDENANIEEPQNDEPKIDETTTTPNPTTPEESSGAEQAEDATDLEETLLPDIPFTDIENHWAKASILFMLNMNLLTPTSETTVSPNEIITRAEFVSILGTHAGIPAELPAQYSFFDVSVDAPYAPHVAWATQHKIISGFSDDLFLPDDPLTREQMATILVRYTNIMNFKLPVLYYKVDFADNDLIGYWAKSSVSALQTAGLLIGNTSLEVNPKGLLTRAEVSTVLEKFITLTNQYGYDL